MEKERALGHASELGQTDFGDAPKAFDAVDMMRAVDELILAVIDAKVTVAYVDQTVIAAPAV